MEVTITRLEQMQLSAEGLLDPGSLVWSQEITHEKAHDLLEKELYRYKQVGSLKCNFVLFTLMQSFYCPSDDDVKTHLTENWLMLRLCMTSYDVTNSLAKEA